MKIPTKKTFYKYMDTIYTGFKDAKAYETFKEILNRSHDEYIMGELYEMTDWDEKQRLQYRYALACQGVEFTPSQVDQYISIIEYAIDYIESI